MYARAKAVMPVRHGPDPAPAGASNVQMLVNLLLLRGNIGKPGAGICPVRGHSNVQGQRTVGITEKPELAPLDKLQEQYGFEPPRKKGMNTVEACEGILAARCAPLSPSAATSSAPCPRPCDGAAWRKLPLTVQISTKLNRSHVIHGRRSPTSCLASGGSRSTASERRQAVTIEDSTALHPRLARQAEPASPTAVGAGHRGRDRQGDACAEQPNVDWDAWVADYGKSATRSGDLSRQLQRLQRANVDAGGFGRPFRRATAMEDRDRQGQLHGAGRLGRSATAAPPGCSADHVRSNDQFNTTIYSFDDRLRGISGTRKVLLMHEADMRRLGILDGEIVDLVGEAGDGVERLVVGFRATRYDVPRGNCAGYYPECNPLLPLWHHAKRSHVPAAKSIPVRIQKRAN